MKPHEEYLRRAPASEVLNLAPLHHYVMDKLFSDLCDGFTLDDALGQYSKDPLVFNDPAIDGIGGRIKLVVIRAIEGLVAVGMLRASDAEQMHYFFRWQSPDE